MALDFSWVAGLFLAALLLVALVIVGVVLAFVPIDQTIRNVIVCIIVIAVILTVAHGFGWIGGTRHFVW